MMRHYGPDDDNHSCWYNYAHKGGPEQPNFLKTGGISALVLGQSILLDLLQGFPKRVPDKVAFCLSQ